MDKLLDIKDVLPIIGCTEKTFRTWLRRGQLPKGLILEIGTTKKVRPVILEKWINGEVV